MHTVAIFGAGNIGSLIACLLAESGRYHVLLLDNNQEQLAEVSDHKHLHKQQVDVTDEAALDKLISARKVNAVVASLPYFFNIPIAKLAKKHGLHYFDLTEDVEVADQVKLLAEGQKAAFVPRCGLAPGFINIVANDLVKQFKRVQDAKLRVGCLPISANNDLKYALTWSTDGLINEYGNECYGLINGKKVSLRPLESLEEIEIDGIKYEAFNTSGGIGSMADTYLDKVNNMTYKTLRYPGHRDKIRFLMDDLKLNQHRDILKNILENALPRTNQDVSIIYAAVSGYNNGDLLEKSFIKKIYPTEKFNRVWSSIQISTASSVCAVVDMVMKDEQDYHGHVMQEQFQLKQFLDNEFGSVYA